MNSFARWLKDNASGLSLFGLLYLPPLAVTATITLTLSPCPVTLARTLPREPWSRATLAPFANAPFRRLLAIFVVGGIAAAIPAKLFQFFVEDVLGAARQAGTFLLIYFVCAAAGMPLWVRASARFGKQRAWFFGMLLRSPDLSAQPCSAAATPPLLPPLRHHWFCSGRRPRSCALITGRRHRLRSAPFAESAASAGAGRLFRIWNLATKLSLALAAASLCRCLRCSVTRLVARSTLSAPCLRFMHCCRARSGCSLPLCCGERPSTAARDAIHELIFIQAAESTDRELARPTRVDRRRQQRYRRGIERSFVATRRAGNVEREEPRGARAHRDRYVESALVLPLDVTNGEELQMALGEITSAWGGLDLALFVAGAHAPMRADTFDLDAARRLFDVNVIGVLHGPASGAPLLLSQGSGGIGIVSSVAGYRGLPTALAYGASKAALINLAETLYFDLRRKTSGCT